MKKNNKGFYTLERPYTDFGSFLARKRNDAGLSQREVSLKLKYSSAQFISNFERGLALPPLKKLKTIIGLYGLCTRDVENMLVLAERKRIQEALK
jgi:transcriptional regulator with XRE-family HTH domain